MSETSPAARRRGPLAWLAVAVLFAVVTWAIASLLISIFKHKMEAQRAYIRLVDVTEETIDPAEWGKNWPLHYDMYRRTVDTERTRFGGSEALPEQKLERWPWLKRIFAGYAFALDFREERGHAYMLYDQEHTERVTQRPQPGACLHCHASVMPLYRKLGDGDVFKGFEESCKLPYAEANKLLHEVGGGHPVSCVDCHDPQSMLVRVTRPGFIRGIQALAASDDAVPHLPSIERWRAGARDKPYDPNVDASRQEMRSFACAQCHVEYYCGPKETLFFPWQNGLKVEQVEKTYDEHKFPDGHRFFDWKHADSGAEVIKAQHPEFEVWSQGTHARAGVACADCHMPYQRVGAAKVSDHHVRSPLLNIARSCQTCHPTSEADLMARVETIQDRTSDLMERAAAATVELIDGIKSAAAAGATDEQLAGPREMQRKAQLRLDWVAADNSMGFHAPQECARILGESIDYARRGIADVARLTPAKVAGR